MRKRQHRSFDLCSIYLILCLVALGHKRASECGSLAAEWTVPVSHLRIQVSSTSAEFWHYDSTTTILGYSKAVDLSITTLCDGCMNECLMSSVSSVDFFVLRLLNST